MNKNRVEIQGETSWNPPPYFDLILREGQSPLSFLCFNVVVPRDKRQPNKDYPSDAIRVVAYGALAERAYATLEPETDVEVFGWLQSRRTKHGTVLEVVAREIAATGQILPRRMLERLRAIAARQGMQVREVTSLLLEPPLTAIESTLGDTEDA